jgi:hypothetical protein
MQRPLVRTIAALGCAGAAIAVFYVGSKTGATNTRAFDGCLAVLLMAGTYSGIGAFRSKAAPAVVRCLALAAAVLCAPYAVVLSVVTVLGLG